MNAEPLRLSVRPLFRKEADELVLAIPERGITHFMLSQPLEELGFEDTRLYAGARVETPERWRWSTVDAAFLAGVLQRLDWNGRRLPLRGLPADLEKLLDLARNVPQGGPDGSNSNYNLITRLGMLTFAWAAEVRAFLDLLGEVVYSVPRYAE